MKLYIYVGLVMWIRCIYALSPPRLRPNVPYFHVVVPEGDEAVLHCPVESPKKLFVEWLRGKEPVDIIWIRRFWMSRNELHIKDVTLSDTGVYTCKAVNGYGTIDVNITLTVSAKKKQVSEQWIQNNNLYPEVDSLDFGSSHTRTRFLSRASTDRQIHRSIGSSVRFKCRAVGNPQPLVQWLKNGSELRHDTGSLSSSRRGIYTLRIDSVKVTDTGMYTCLIRNKYDTIMNNFSLVVSEPLEKPHFVGFDPINITTHEGDGANFSCSVRSKEKPHFKWLKLLPRDEIRSSNVVQEKNVLQVEDKFYQGVNFPSSMTSLDRDIYRTLLHVQNTTERDTGIYICWAANVQGYTTRSAYLEVLVHQGVAGDWAFYITAICTAAVFAVVLIVAIFHRVRRRCSKKSVPLTNRFPIQRTSKINPEASEGFTAEYMNSTCGSSCYSTQLSNKTS